MSIYIPKRPKSKSGAACPPPRPTCLNAIQAGGSAAPSPARFDWRSESGGGAGRRGFSLIELIVAISVFSVLIAGVTFLVGGPFSGSSNNREAERFAREALGAVDIIKERSWTQIDGNSDGTDKKVNRDSNGDWVISSGTETRGSFTRAIKITSVERDSSGVIVASGGTNDPSTKKIAVTISASGVADYVLETYVTNWESYRMLQTDWSGSSGTNVWTDASTGYSSSSSINGFNLAGSLRLASST